MDAPNKVYVEVCDDGIFAFPEPPFYESVEYIRADLVEQPLQQEQPEVESLIRCELPDMEDDKNLGLCYCNQFGNHRMTSKDVQEIAHHFYELGLRARKEE